MVTTRPLILLSLLLSVVFSLVYASTCGECTRGQKNCQATCDKCCLRMGGVSYCDSSAGRVVCRNGVYSSCYCTRHAIMDLEHIQGCCIWQGGVLTVDNGNGLVVCNNGSVSPICSEQSYPENIATW